MKCLIIAGGKGSRLRRKGDTKPLIPLLGLPIIERVVLTAKRCGLTDFYIVSGYNHEKVIRFLDRLRKRWGVRIVNIINPDWEKENGYSVYQARSYLKERFLLLMADHLFDEDVIKLMMRTNLKDGEVCLAVDRNIKNHYVDPTDATKVLIENGRIIDIGKTIRRFNGYDTGIFLCTPVIFSALEESFKHGDTTLSGGVRVLAEEGRVRPVEITGKFWIDIDDERAFRKAEAHLVKGVIKSSDGPIARYLNRPISVLLTRLLVRTDVKPNLISVFSFLIAVMAAILFFLSQPLLGAVLTQVSSIVDGCDGEVARLKYLASELGGWLDSILDRYADGLILFGLTYHAFQLNPIALIFGFGALIGSLINSYIAIRYDRMIRDRYRIGRDLRLFIIFISVVAGFPLYGLLLLAIIMNLENIRRVIIILRHG
ncbi:hypothetical protein DRP53_07740 [candidate division WOR-3 bacterium]|uniref:Bifunctional IPC transferase and DIPP synthase n=1 Tax=candidate division WOR-3 bacterium TaxID=2052148 RepID=A0A660SFW9_UNCW3|nr:MAG: hypothetical protein DRP53_07740 [candidate division WOR-3 bacterium]